MEVMEKQENFKNVKNTRMSKSNQLFNFGMMEDSSINKDFLESQYDIEDENREYLEL